jgi:hypothetical protein
VHAVHTPVPTAPVASGPSVPAPPRPTKIESEPSFTRGLIGIAAASFIGLLLWFAITHLTGLRIKWIAVLIGGFIGWTGAWLAKEKSVRLGLASAIATALVVILGLLWSARHEAFIAVNESLDGMWQEQVAYAKAAVQASRSDAELRKFIEENGSGVEEFDEEDEEFDNVLRVSASGNSAADAKVLSDFRKNELPELRKYADGKVSKNQFEREFRPTLEAVYTIGFIIGSTFRIKVLIFVGLAIGAAWKLTSGQ